MKRLFCLLMAIMILLTAAGCMKAAASTPSPEPSAPPSPAFSPEPTPKPSPVPVTLAETEDMGQAYIDGVIFFGDSNIRRLTTLGLVENKNVWATQSGVLTLGNWDASRIVYPETGEDLFVWEAAERAKPPLMIITMGTNGVSFLEEAYFKKAYTAMVEAIREASPDTRLILNSIYPVDETLAGQAKLTNARIAAANDWIRSIAEAEGARYLDTNAYLADESGSLAADYCDRDGYHLTYAGEEQVLNVVRTHAWEDEA